MANYDLQYEGPAIDSILDTGKKLEDDGYIFLGLAASNTTSGTPDKRVFYFAGPGSYSGFGVTIPTGAVGIFAYNGSAWVTSVINTGSIYDVSSANSGRTYASLSTAIEDIPSTARKAGMEIKFVNTSTSKYEVWIYQGTSTSSVDFTNTANWIGVDETPLSGSNNLVSSGGIYAAIQNAFDKLDMMDSTGTSVQSIQINVTLRRNDGTEEDPDWQTVASLVLPSATTTKAGLMSADDKAKITNTDGVFDISEYTASGGTPTQYSSLSAALGTNGINVPQNIRKGGMSVKFVQSSDNKYVQYRLMSDSFNTTPSNWQGVDDEPTVGSKNLVESGGVLKAINDSNEPVVYETTGNSIQVKSFTIKKGDMFEIELLDTLSTPSTIKFYFINTSSDFVQVPSYMRLNVAGDKAIIICPDNVHVNWIKLYNETSSNGYRISIRRVDKSILNNAEFSTHSIDNYPVIAKFYDCKDNIYKATITSASEGIGKLSFVQDGTENRWNVGSPSSEAKLNVPFYIVIPTEEICSLYINNTTARDATIKLEYIGNINDIPNEALEKSVSSIESNDIYFKHQYANTFFTFNGNFSVSNEQSIEIDISNFKKGDTLGYEIIEDSESNTNVSVYLVRQDNTYIQLTKATSTIQKVLLTETFNRIRFYKNGCIACYKVAISKLYGDSAWLQKTGTQHPTLFTNSLASVKAIKLIFNTNEEGDSYTFSIHWKQNSVDKYTTVAKNIHQNTEYVIAIPSDIITNADANYIPSLYTALASAESVINYKFELLEDTLNTDNVAKYGRNYLTSTSYPVLLRVKGNLSKIIDFSYSAVNNSETFNINLSYKKNGTTNYTTLISNAEQNKNYKITLPKEILDIADTNFEPQLYINSSNVIYAYSTLSLLNEQPLSLLKSARILILGDSYSRGAYYVDAMRACLPPDTTIVNLGVTSCTIRDKYQDRQTYPYTSRPVSTDNSGNHNTLACQVEKLKRLMAGVDLDSGETQIYQNESDYPNIIILEGAMNDTVDSDAIEETYFAQMVKRMDNVWFKNKNDANAQQGTCYIKTPISEVNRTCFAGAYRYVVEELTALFPNAQFFITTASNMGYWTYDVIQRRCKQAEQQRKCAKMLGYTCIDWNAEGQINGITDFPSGEGTESSPYIYNATTRQTSDLMHPNTYGGKKYGRLVALVIKQRFMNINDE